MKILIVDDELVSLSKLDLWVQGLGYQTVLAKDGLEAWKIWLEEEIPIVITDWLMPVMDGLELCKKIRASGRNVYTYIIMVTAKEGRDDFLTGIEAGADDFISKPFTRQDLVARLRAGQRILDFQKKLIKVQEDLEGEIRERKKAEEGLAAYLDQLEEIVQSRTSDLTRAKEQLEAELLERKRLEEEKVRLEKQILQSQKMEAVGTLAGGIAHDFNNILFSIMGYSEMVLDDLPEDSLTRSNVEEVLRATNRAKELIGQILTFSREGETKRESIRIQPILKETIKLLRSTLPTHILFQETIDMDCGPILADPAQIHQLVINLCTNAYHAMLEKGGTLGVALTEVEVGVEEYQRDRKHIPGKYLKLTVQDTGHGMEPSVMKRIFEPYFTTRKPGQGNGMGLAVSHGIMENYGGWITVFSEPGQGATFDLFFPMIDGQSDLADPLFNEPVPGGTEHILLVDDEETLLPMLEHILSRLGYRISAFNRSAEALSAFQNDPVKFDLVITDQAMPHMIGSELAKRILNIRPDMPIILFTGFSDLITEEKAKSLGIRAYVMKPIIKHDLAGTIRRILDEQKEGDL
jgi:CheY-like chemotaxis protein